MQPLQLHKTAVFDRAVSVLVLLVLCGIAVILYRMGNVPSSSRFEYKIEGRTVQVFDRATGTVHWLLLQDAEKATSVTLDAVNGRLERRAAAVKADGPSVKPWDVVPPAPK